jgi:hypothetical protein
MFLLFVIIVVIVLLSYNLVKIASSILVRYRLIRPRPASAEALMNVREQRRSDKNSGHVMVKSDCGQRAVK